MPQPITTAGWLPTPPRDGMTICARCSTERTDTATYCPACGGILVMLSPAPPSQESLFDIPPAPQPNHWRVEWRWKAETQDILASVIDPAVLPENDWIVHGTWGWPATERIARCEARRLRYRFPGKSVRIVPVYD